MDFKEWFSNLGEAWTKRDPQAAANLFSKDCQYYESVFGNPCTSWEEILKLWLVVPQNQKNITFDFEIISTEDNLAVANWKVSRILLPSNEHQDIDGIFVVKLDDEGLCNYFKQWRSVNK